MGTARESQKRDDRCAPATSGRRVCKTHYRRTRLVAAKSTREFQPHRVFPVTSVMKPVQSTEGKSPGMHAVIPAVRGGDVPAWNG